MFELRGSFFFLFLCLLPALAHAKTINFSTGSDFGLGLLGGASQNPSSDLVTAPYYHRSDYSYFAGVEPYLDFGNFLLRMNLQYHNLGVLSGPTDSNTYNDTSDSQIILIGGSLVLVPFLSQDQKLRSYFRLGGGLASLSGENARTYSSGAKYFENFSADAINYEGSVGFEVLFIQNYSLALEFGYRELVFDTIQFESGTSLTGTTQIKGQDLETSGGTKKSLKYNGAFATLGFNLNF
jgi:hypothetical protein